MNVLDLFSGIGAFSLGLERAGFETVAFCEINPFRREVLKKHWPQVPIYDDVRDLTAERLRADGVRVDVICGGFPCTDISIAGKGAGIEGKNSKLWTEFARLIGEVRPRYAIVENVSVLAVRGLRRVLWDTWKIGYDAEWYSLRACDVGAPHERDRIWIIAYPIGFAVRHESGRRSGACRPGETVAGNNGEAQALADTGEVGRQIIRFTQYTGQQSASGSELDRCGEGGWRDWPPVADADDAGRGDGEESDAGSGEPRPWPGADRAAGRGGDDIPDTGGAGLSLAERTALFGAGRRDEGRAASEHDRRGPVCGLGRTFDGPATWLDANPWGPGWEDGVSRVAVTAEDKIDRRKRVMALGDSLVPQIPELIGRAIIAAQERGGRKA